MDQVINFGVPHVAKKIFEHVDINGLVQCLYVSGTWRQLAEEVLMNRLSETDGYGRTPFMFACENGHKYVVKLLLDYSGTQEIDFNQQSSVERTAFMLACKRGHLEVIRLLLYHSESKSIDLKKRDMHGLTALMIACEYGQNEVFQLILYRLADEAFDSGVVDENGLNTFMLACKFGRTEMVQAMLDHPQRKKLKIKDSMGRTQFMDGFWQASRFSQLHVGVIQLILDQPGVDLNVFMAACQYGQQKLVKFLMENSVRYKIDLNATDALGNTAFIKACAYGRDDIVSILLTNSENTHLNLNAINNEGKTGLMWACENGQDVVVLILVGYIERRYNIQLNIRDTSGQTALLLACNEGHVGVVRLLLNLNNIEIPNIAEIKTSPHLAINLPIPQLSINLQSIQDMLRVKLATLALEPQRNGSEAEPIEQEIEEAVETVEKVNGAETYADLMEDLDFILESDEVSEDTDTENDD